MLQNVYRRASPVRADALHDLVVCAENKSSRNTRVFPHPAVLFSEQTFLSAESPLRLSSVSASSLLPTSETGRTSCMPFSAITFLSRPIAYGVCSTHCP